MNERRLALITGGNRGLGLEIGRQLARQGVAVILGSRDESAGKAAAAELAGQGLADVSSARIDATDEGSGGLRGAGERTVARPRERRSGVSLRRRRARHAGAAYEAAGRASGVFGLVTLYENGIVPSKLVPAARPGSACAKPAGQCLAPLTRPSSPTSTAIVLPSRT